MNGLGLREELNDFLKANQVEDVQTFFADKIFFIFQGGECTNRIEGETILAAIKLFLHDDELAYLAYHIIHQLYNDNYIGFATLVENEKTAIPCILVLNNDVGIGYKLSDSEILASSVTEHNH